jgi:hypothetical protein
MLAMGAAPMCAQEATPAEVKPADMDEQEARLPGGIVVSKETTRIEGPRRADRRIDYLEALNRKLSEGVTPENNAAAALYRAIRLDDLETTLQPEFYRRLGVDPPGEADERFLEEDDYAERAVGDDPEKLAAFHEKFYEQLSTAYERPWTGMERLELAGWLKANAKPLEQIAAGLERPRYYMPLVTSEECYQLVNASLPGIMPAREVGRAFASRAMMHLGEGKLDEARADLLSAHRLARHIGRGPTLIEALVGITIDRLALSGDTALAHCGKLTTDQARAYAAELAKLPRVTDMLEKIDIAERYMFLDCVMTLAVEGPEGLDALVGDGGGGDSPLSKAIGKLLSAALIDWNEPLKIGNVWYDKLVAAGRKATYAERDAALDAFEEDLKTFVEESRDPVAMLGKVLLSGKSPGKAVGGQMGNILIALLLPAVRAAVTAEDRHTEQFELTHLALLLAAYRAEHGAYPETLDALAPKYVAELPRDLFTGEALKYRRTDGGGYMLYSVGPNRTDDGGAAATGGLDGDIVVATP